MAEPSEGQKLPITLCVITFNEQDQIAECLASADFVSEVVVVDSYSTDSTEDLCRDAGAHVRFYQHPFDGHIQQKNLALQKAKQPWVLALDADERVSPAMRSAILEIFSNEPRVDGYSFRRVTQYMGRWIRHGAFYPDRKVRLFRRDKARWGGQNPHDRIVLSGRQEQREEEILHYSFDDLSDHIRTINSFSTIQARQIFGANPAAGQHWVLTRMLARSAWVVFRHLVLRAGILDGRRGVIIALFSAFSMLARYAKVYEMVWAQSLSKKGQDAHRDHADP
jgi:glycosyltransferase involved in cell wall biosynthesis